MERSTNLDCPVDYINGWSAGLSIVNVIWVDDWTISHCRPLDREVILLTRCRSSVVGRTTQGEPQQEETDVETQVAGRYSNSSPPSSIPSWTNHFCFAFNFVLIPAQPELPRQQWKGTVNRCPRLEHINLLDRHIDPTFDDARTES